MRRTPGAKSRGTARQREAFACSTPSGHNNSNNNYISVINNDIINNSNKY